MTITMTVPVLPDTFTDRALMRIVGQQAIVLIKRRTLSGIDAEGAAFAAYSEGYARAKAKAFGSSGTPDLHASGAMLNGLVVRAVDETSVTLGWV